jgi:hypothetical protein
MKLLTIAAATQCDPEQWRTAPKKNHARTRSMLVPVMSVMLCVGLTACGGGGGGNQLSPDGPNNPGTPGNPGAGDAPAARILSSKAEHVSGGSALIEIMLPASAPAGSTLSVSANGSDVSGAFNADPATPGRLLGVVSGLRNGTNALSVNYGSAGTSLNLTNYPISGPILSGPQTSPFICQTQDFTLPDGSSLGAPTDANCSAPARVTYLYRPAAGGALRPLANTSNLPNDVGTTTTSTGRTVPFVVRVETGTIDRGIYQSAVLHDPSRDPAPAPLTPPPGWNKRLVALQGSGCTGGWYVQGRDVGVDLFGGDNLTRLAQGYALYANSLNNPSNNCNATLAAEAAMMGKENFIESYGPPLYTVAVGSSGGAYLGLQIADAMPGVFDGVFVDRTFPDALTLTNAALDAHLLAQYFLTDNSAGLSQAQMIAVSGHKNLNAWYDLALQSGRADPVPGRASAIPPSDALGSYRSAVWDPAVPSSMRYHPTGNRQGARPTVFDVARNIYGIDPATGFALRPFDNVGVQYGLQALNLGIISKAQFLALNERVGGYDQDANFVGTRNSADAGAVRRAYQSGMLLGGNGGLASIPVFDLSGTYDEDGAYHYQWFHFAVRERIARANGNAANVVMWRGDPATSSGAPAGAVTARAWNVFIQWMDAYRSDTSGASQREKVISRKPAAATDGCFARSSTLQFIAEPQSFGTANSQCNQLWPSYASPRLAAGEDLTASNLKCQLKPISASDYAVTFDASERARLNAIFPAGVCDSSRPGVNQTAVVPYASFGPSPVNRVFDIANPG